MRTASDIIDSIHFIRTSLGMPSKGYHGTSRTALLIIEGNLRRLHADWVKQLKPRNVNAEAISKTYSIRLIDAQAFAEFAKNR